MVIPVTNSSCKSRPVKEKSCGNLAVGIVPDVKLDALRLVNPAPDPTNDDAVIIPLALISPTLFIPTPSSTKLSGLPATWKTNDGFVVATPTFPAE